MGPPIGPIPPGPITPGKPWNGGGGPIIPPGGMGCIGPGPGPMWGGGGPMNGGGCCPGSSGRRCCCI
jgi:hypothetical protein